METPTYILVQPHELFQEKKPLSKKDFLEAAKFVGGMAGIFIILQILGIMYEIFVLQQRLLDPDEKGSAIWAIVFYVIKNAYAMVVLGTLFIMTKGLCKTMKLPSWLLLGVQSFFSIKAILHHWHLSKQPTDPESMENVYELVLTCAYLIEYIVFLCMVISFLGLLGNPPTQTIYSQLQDKEEQEE